MVRLMNIIKTDQKLLHLNRSSLYYRSKGEDPHALSLLNEIRDIWMRYPFYGYRRITWVLRQQGFKVNRKRVQRLMKLAGIQAIYPGPNTSRRNKKHAVHPYLFKGMEITAPIKPGWWISRTLRLIKDLCTWLRS